MVWCIWNNERYDVDVIPGDLVIKPDSLEVTVNPERPSAEFNDEQQSPNVGYTVTGTNSGISLSSEVYTVGYRIGDAWVDEAPSFTDVDEYTITYKITPDSNNYLPYEGSFIFVITGTTNSFTTEFDQDDWTYREGKGTSVEPVSKFGNPTVRYYTDPNHTEEYTGGMDNDTPAGTYYVVVSVPADGDNYPELTGYYEFTVNRATLHYEWDQTMSITYTGDDITNTLTVDHWSVNGVGEAIAVGGTGESVVMYSNPSVDVTIDSGRLSMTATDVGRYSVVLTITDPNYMWDGEDADTLTIETAWEIVEDLMENGWTEDPGIDSIVFGEILSPRGTPEHGTATYYFSRSSNLESFNSTERPTQAGTYYMLVVVRAVTDGGVHYERLVSEPIEFEIQVRTIDVPSIVFSTKFSPGDVQTVDLSDLGMDPDDQAYVSMSGDSGTSAATYTAILTLTDKVNCAWNVEGGTSTEDQSVQWTITPLEVEFDTDDFGSHDDDAYYDYDTTLKTYNPSFYDSKFMDISGNTGRDAGTYTVIVTLTSTDYVWKGIEERSVTFGWNIDPRALTMPTLRYDTMDGASLVIPYGGSSITVTLNGFDAQTMGIVTHGTTVSSSDDGTISSTVGIGSYSFDISLKTSNYVWVGQDVDVRSIQLTLNVTANRVDVPDAMESEFEYDGESHSILFDDTSNLIIENNVHTNAGTYVVTVRPAEGFYWQDGTSDAVEFTLTIDRVTVVIMVDGDIEVCYGEDIPEIGWTYAEGSDRFVNEDLTNGTIVVTIIPGASNGDNVGTYLIQMTAVAGNNYIVTCLNGNLTINPAIVDVPSDIGNVPGLAYDSDGVTFDPAIQWGDEYDEGTMSVSDNFGTDIGVQTSYLHLRDPINHVWNTGASADIEFHWEIVKKPVSIVIPDQEGSNVPGVPGQTVDLGEYEASGEPLDIVIGGFDSTCMRVESDPEGCFAIDPVTGVMTITAKDLGTYTIRFYLVDEHYEWSSPTNSILMTLASPTPKDALIMTFTFTIVANSEGEEYTVEAGHNSLVYDGEEQSYVPDGFDSDHMTLGGTTNATIPGTYTVTVTLKDPIDRWGSLDDDGDGTIYITWTITKRPVTLTAESGSMALGGDMPELDVLGTDGFVDDGLDDLFTVSFDLVDPDVPGEYTVRVEKVGDHAALAHYDIEFVDGKILVMSGDFRELFVLDGVTDPETYNGTYITKPISSPHLTLGEEYTVTYADNIDVGVATVTITGLGNYSDQSLSFQFEILKADPPIRFDQESVSRYPDDGSFTNPLVVPDYVVTEGSATYVSSDPSVAYVDPVTGLVTTGSAGTAVITVTVPGTENYNDSTAWFTVIVSSTPMVVIPGDDDVIVLPGPETVKWYQKDISLYILLIVILVVGFLLYIVYTVWKRRGDGQ